MKDIDNPTLKERMERGIVSKLRNQNEVWNGS